jgi:DNA polymerase III subunit gamma/tau
MAELSRADFRLDPASPIPLEVACATAILGAGLAAPVAMAPVAASPAPAGRPAASGQVQRPNAPAAVPSNTPLTAQEKFARELFEHCKMVNPSLAMWLNGSFEVLEMEGDDLVLGFVRKMPMEKVDTTCRPMVEEQAAAILGRKVNLVVKLVEQDAATPRRETRRGHLAEAARAMGATPVGKD